MGVVQRPDEHAASRQRAVFCHPSPSRRLSLGG
jgi:hypothetical protein